MICRRKLLYRDEDLFPTQKIAGTSLKERKTYNRSEKFMEVKDGFV